MSSTVQEAIKTYRENPPKFFVDVLGFNAWEKQAKIATSVAKNRKTAVRSCHDSGKTAIAARIALWFLFTHAPSVVITTAPTYRQVSELLWREMRFAYRASKVPLGGRIYETPQLNVMDNWYSIGLSTDDPTRFQGFHSENILLIVDEAPGVDQVIFDASEGILTSSNAKTLLIGNPNELSGEFYNAFHKSRSSYNTMSISAFDTPNFTKFGITLDDIRNGQWEKKSPRVVPAPYLVTPLWVNEKYRDWGEESPLWQVKVLGRFPSSVLNTLLTIAEIEKNIEYGRTHLPTDRDREMQHRYGVDVARYGDDHTVITHGQGRHVIDVFAYSKEDTMQTTGRVAELIRKNPGSRVTIDVDGVGAGVFDRLQEMVRDGEIKVDLYGFRGAAKPSLKHIEKYENARAEAWVEFAAKVKRNDVILRDHDQMVGELSAVKYLMHSKGKLLIEKKDDIKKRIGHSPDFADSVVLCFHEAVKSGWVDYFDEISSPYRKEEEEEEKQETERENGLL